MADRTHFRRRETGAAATGLVVLLATLIIGAGIGVAVRRTQPPNIPAMDLAASASVSTVEIEDSTIPPSTLELPTTVEATTTITPETTVPETTPPTTEPPLSADLSLEADGSVLKSAQSGERRLVSPDLGCDGFTAVAVAGSAAECGDLVFGGTAKWVVNSDGVLEVLRQAADVAEGDVWDVVLVGSNSGRSVEPFVEDLTGDGVGDLVVSWNDGESLSIDVATLTELGARVSMHVDLPNGRARIDGGSLNVWFDAGVDDMFTHAVIERSDGRWRARALDQVPVDSVGASQL
jgi:hypothetical protein